MPIIPRFQQESDPNQPPRLDFAERIMQGMTAGAQTQRFAAEADYRRQMAAMQQEAMDVARQERAMSQQERADIASIEGFFAVPGVAAPAGGMIGGPAPVTGEVFGPPIRPSEAFGGYAMPPEKDTALAGAQAFASQLKTDSARAMFFNRFAQARKDELVRVEAQKTQESFSNLLMGIKGNDNLAGKFDSQIEALTSMLNKLGDPDQTAESKAQILSIVTSQIAAMEKAGNDEENRINRYKLTIGQYENMIAGMKDGSQEKNALIAQYSAFKNNPNAGIADIETQQTAITNISAGRTEYSPKLKDWFTPADRMKREAEMYASSVQQNFTNLKLAEAQAQIQMFNLQAEGAAMDLEKSYAENAMKIHDMQFVTDELGARALGISPDQYRSPAAIEQDLRSAGARAPKVNVPSGAVGAAPAAQTAGPAAQTAGPTAGGAVDLAVEDLLGNQQQGSQQKGSQQQGGTQPSAISIDPKDYTFDSFVSNGKLSSNYLDAALADLKKKQQSLYTNRIVRADKRSENESVERSIKNVLDAKKRIDDARSRFEPAALLERAMTGPFASFGNPYALEEARRKYSSKESSESKDFAIFYQSLANDPKHSEELERLSKLSDEDLSFESSQYRGGL